MLAGKKYNGICSDIWSCGIILYTMLVGNIPCSESKEELVYQNIMTHNFYYPENLSDDAIDLMEHLLKTDPEERYNFDEIKAHPWFNILTPKLRPGIVFNVHKIPIDPKILEKVEEFGYDRKKVEDSVMNSRYDSFSAVYYLILKQFKKKGISSVSDLYSGDYLKYLKDYKNWIDQSKINDPLFKDYEVDLLDTLNEDEMLWVPDADSASDLSNMINQQNDEKIKKDDNSNKNLDKINDISKQNEIENNIEQLLSDDIIFNDSKTNDMIKNLEKNNYTNHLDKTENASKYRKNINEINNKKALSPNINDRNIKRNFMKNNNKTNTKNKNQKTLFNLMKSNLSLAKEIQSLTNNTTNNKIKNKTKSTKNVGVISPSIKNNKNNNQLSLCEKIIFDNINELEAESKVLSLNSAFF